jgi:Putative peptidoglycan binding domain
MVGATTNASKTSTAKKKSTGAQGNSSTASRKATTAKAGSTKKAPTTTSRRTTYRPPARARQLQPTPERYKEIQQALVSKGYLSGEPSGTWNQESADALRRFQQDQNINASGKIDSLSLIALGLGPKREAAPAPPGPPEPKAETPAQAPAVN